MKNFVGEMSARINHGAFPAVLQCLAVVAVSRKRIRSRRRIGGGKEKIGVRKRIPGKENQEKTRCANERLRVTEDVDVDNSSY